MTSIYSVLKRSCDRLNLRREDGQGVIEYVLVLIVVVGVILGVLYQFNQAFRVWADNYFGDYLACLLETGELPALSGAAGICNQQYQAFSIADGRPLVGRGLGEGDGEDGDSDGADTTGRSSASAVGGGAGRSGTLNGEGFGSGANRFRAGGSAGGGKEGDDSQQGNTGSASVTSLSGYQEDRVIRIPVGSRGGFRGAYTSDKKKEKTTFQAGKLDQGETPASKPKLLRIERKIAQVTIEDDEGLTFGNFLRILLMAAIIIAIIVFLGGQLLQASKNME